MSKKGSSRSNSSSNAGARAKNTGQNRPAAQNRPPAQNKTPAQNKSAPQNRTAAQNKAPAQNRSASHSKGYVNRNGSQNSGNPSDTPRNRKNGQYGAKNKPTPSSAYYFSDTPDTGLGKPDKKPQDAAQQPSAPKPSAPESGSLRSNSKKQNRPRRRKNELALDDHDERDRYKTRSAFDSSAEEVLDKPIDDSLSVEYLKPLSPARKPDSPYIRKLRRVLIGIAVIGLLVVVCCVLSLTVFFKIDMIEVEGATRYDSDSIIAQCMIHTGENLILCNTAPGAENIEKSFPYIDTVTIDKELVNRIVIRVTEASPQSIVESGGKYYVLSKRGKVLEINDKASYDVVLVLGAKLQSGRLARQLVYKDSNASHYLEEIKDAISKYGIADIKIIDISNLSKIVLKTGSGFSIILGSPENIDYKLQTAKTIMDKSVSPNDTGTLDVSLASANGGKSYLQSNLIESEPAPKPAPKPEAQNSGSSSAPESSQTSDTSDTDASDSSSDEEPTDVSDGGGDSDEGDSDEGDSDEGDSDEGDSDEGDSGEGDSGEGDSGEGDSGEGDSDEGDSDEGDSDDDTDDQNNGDDNE